MVPFPFFDAGLQLFCALTGGFVFVAAFFVLLMIASQREQDWKESVRVLSKVAALALSVSLFGMWAIIPLSLLSLLIIVSFGIKSILIAYDLVEEKKTQLPVVPNPNVCKENA